MNAHSFDTESVPVIETPRHQRALKAALLQAHASSQGKFISFPSKFMSLFKYIAPVGATVTLAVLLAQSQGTDLPTLSNPLVIEQVSAQEVLNSTIQEFQSLTDAQIQALNERLGVPCEDVLIEARNASDLHLATIERSVVGDEVQYSFGDEGGAISMTGANGSNDLDALTFLEYTREDGSIVRLGVNAQDDYMPTFIFTSFAEDAAGETGDIMIFNSSSKDANLEDSSSVTQTVEECEGPSTSWTSEDGMMGGGGC